MKAVLADGDIQLTKSLGQNFLHDHNQLQRIVNAAALEPKDKVLEIGPGLGPLTETLLARAGEVLAIEKDARLVQILERRFGGPRPSGARFTLLHDDALEFLRREPGDWTGWKMVSNLPYSVASPILVELALSARGPQLMVATLQLEVAQRLMAKADSESYGTLTLLAQLHYEPRGWFKIPAGCFFPEPEVDSACVVLARRAAPLLGQAQQPTYIKLVKASFAQRRKMMAKLLKAHWPPEAVREAFAQLNIPLTSRAEALDLRQFVDLARRLEAAK